VRLYTYKYNYTLCDSHKLFQSQGKIFLQNLFFNLRFVGEGEGGRAGCSPTAPPSFGEHLWRNVCLLQSFSLHNLTGSLPIKNRQFRTSRRPPSVIFKERQSTYVKTCSNSSRMSNVSEVFVQCPVWLFSVVSSFHAFLLCCSGIFWMTLR
jgi:hypothetical protein